MRAHKNKVNIKYNIFVLALYFINSESNGRSNDQI
jgi:hypothetical protein